MKKLILLSATLLALENREFGNGEHEQPALSREIFMAVRANNQDWLRSVMQKNYKEEWWPDVINYRDPATLQSPLMMAVLSGLDIIVEILISDINVQVLVPEKDGYTPMHGAGFQGRANIIKIMMDPKKIWGRKIDPNIMHSDGYRPIHRACWGMEQRHTDAVKAFIEVGVPFNVRDSRGRSCYDMTRNEETKKFLREIMEKMGIREEL